MIGRLRGRLISESPEGIVLLEVGGVGYEAMTPVGTLGQAEHQGEEVVLHIHTHVREEALDLYGFANDTGRKLFRLLITAPNIGPKTALGVMSALPLEALAEAVANDDVVRISKVPGIGKKTAERLILELRGKLPKLQPANQTVGSTDKSTRLLTALTNMGYRPAEAERAVKTLDDRVNTQTMSELLREALARLTP